MAQDHNRSMNTELGSILKRMLRPRSIGSLVLSNRENTKLEFKQSFNFGCMPEYARTMMAFANTDGGFIVFGVRDQPHEIVGVREDRFNAIEPAKITTFLNAHCSPEIDWEFGIIEIYEHHLGFIYTEPHHQKPIITTKNSGKELKEAEIYYRYRALTSVIKFPELRTLIDKLLDQERRAWLQHLSTISKAGAMNVAILDTIQGKLFGAGAPFLIDESLLRQVKIIREGQFTESAGSPTLRLVGEVRTVGGVTTDRIVQRGIHFEDLLTAFLASRPLSKDDARSYLQESCHQMSPFSPIFCFLRQAGQTTTEAVDCLREAKKGFQSTRESIVKRLQRVASIQPISSVNRAFEFDSAPSLESFETALRNSANLKDKRSVIWRMLQVAPDIILGSKSLYASKPLIEAVTHMDEESCIRNELTLKQLLLNVFESEFHKLPPNIQSSFRKTVAFLDEMLNARHVTLDKGSTTRETLSEW